LSKNYFRKKTQKRKYEEKSSKIFQGIRISLILEPWYAKLLTLANYFFPQIIVGVTKLDLVRKTTKKKTESIKTQKK
jgi:hypothetical protein